MACVVIVKLLHPIVYKLLSWIPTGLGILILILFCITMFADLYVTVAGILKWNCRLDKMEEIAGELHRLSEQIGLNISRNMVDGLEKSETAKEKAEELREKYNEMLTNQGRTGKRLIKAFPAMKSQRHSDQIAEIKEYLKKKKG